MAEQTAISSGVLLPETPAFRPEKTLIAALAGFGPLFHVSQRIIFSVIKPAWANRATALAIDQHSREFRVESFLQRLSRSPGQMHDPSCTAVCRLACVPIAHVESAGV